MTYRRDLLKLAAAALSAAAHGHSASTVELCGHQLYACHRMQGAGFTWKKTTKEAIGNAGTVSWKAKGIKAAALPR